LSIVIDTEASGGVRHCRKRLLFRPTTEPSSGIRTCFSVSHCFRRRGGVGREVNSPARVDLSSVALAKEEGGASPVPGNKMEAYAQW